MTKIKISGIEAKIEKTDSYLQINDVSAAGLADIMQQLKTDYATYDRWLCFRNVEPPYALLDELGAKLEDDCAQMFLYDDIVFHISDLYIKRVTENDFDEFAAFHDKCNPSMYWTGERLRRDLSRWGIFYTRNKGQIESYIIMSMGHPSIAEVMCVESKSLSVSGGLLAHATKFAFENQKSRVLFMADYGMSRTAALSVGFVVTGFYKGYKISKGDIL